ncbi:hypothetical protein NDU88_009350 [Pleurodeles waltl]|uniref:Uncharacterized protein n=1 Tax=Pleurodeles waltl TaxID=8319 RepID=A0AAV7RY69_PLEWA|nr:hypothetical protein NDU88_009350 [Pleurodeles waltl]
MPIFLLLLEYCIYKQYEYPLTEPVWRPISDLYFSQTSLGLCVQCACDGPALPDTSVNEAACADAATGNPELEDGGACHLGFPRLKGTRQPTRVLENAEKEGRWAAEGKKSVEETGVWRTENGRPKRSPVKSLRTGRREGPD